MTSAVSQDSGEVYIVGTGQGNGALSGSVVENSMTESAIDRLPPELLIPVFQRVQWLYGWPVESHTNASLLWLRVTWVCHRWRVVALQAPVLWTTISCHNHLKTVESLSAFLERAAGANLNLKLHSSKGRSTLDTILLHSDRVRSLSLVLGDSEEEYFPALVEFFPPVMPALEQLSISDHMSRQWWSSAEGTLLDGRFPRLRHLSLSFFNFHWNSPVYRSLRSLVLFGLTGKEKPTIAQFLGILQACPELESLRAQDFLGGAETDDSGHVVTLPHLRELVLGDTFRRASSLCDQLSVPPACCIDVTYGLFFATQALFDLPIMRILPRQRVFQCHVAHAQSLSLLVGELHVGLQFELGEGVTASVKMFNDVWRLFVTPAEWRASLDSFAGLPLTRLLISYLSLSLLPKALWRNLFSAFPSLNSIVVGYPIVAGLSDDLPYRRPKALDYLGQVLHASDDETDGTYATALRTIQILRAIVDEYMASELLSLVRLRASDGVPLAEVAFVDSYCDRALERDDFVSQLAAFVKISVVYRREDGYHLVATTLEYMMES
ncbi:hypothetical protein BV20DRAFT_537602 [Pilatotrama ljubarskyi]|nr:hypothetical protein BV20DRAFT_537602 [Pilatotrama ljubarskyi]